MTDPAKFDAAVEAYARHLRGLLHSQAEGASASARESGVDVGPERLLEMAVAEITAQPPSLGVLQRLAQREDLDLEQLPSLEDPARTEEAGQAGRYRIEGQVARGGMGAILQVWDAELRRRSAMKVTLPGGGDGTRRAKAIVRLLEEAQITGQLDHPGIVPVHELGLDANGELYFTMRLVKGIELAEAFRLARAGEQGWGRTRAVESLRRVCEAMAYAHSRGVIHRDLKPSNVMVGRFGETYVMDWGLARVVDRKRSSSSPADEELGEQTEIFSDREAIAAETPGTPLLTQEGEALGTPAYMSPEQALGDLDAVGPATDVYAAGAMLYELLCGDPPYVAGAEDLGPMEIWRAVRRAAPRPVAELAPEAPAELRAIAAKAMQRVPADRYADMGAMAEDLRAYLENRVVRAHRTGSLVALEKWIARNRGLAVGAALAVVASVAGLAGLSWVQGARAAERAVSLDRSRARILLSRAPELVGAARGLEDEQREWLQEAERLLQGFDGLEALPAEGRPVRSEGELEQLRQRRAEIEAFEEARTRATGRPEELVEEGRDPEHERRLLDRGLDLFEHDLERWSRRHPGSATPSPAGDQEAIAYAARLHALSGPAGWAAEIRGWYDGREQRREASRSESEQRLWRAAANEVAADPRYESFRLEPIEELVPVGPDPESGLQEFWMPTTGARPTRGQDDRWSIGPETGLVFVLLPPGKFLQGAQGADPDAPGYRPGAYRSEGPPVEVRIARPFLVSKYEVTQLQWHRMGGGLPASRRFPDHYTGGPRIAGTHPVESVSWSSARTTLAAQGLELPSESRWEYAARAGTTGDTWLEGLGPEVRINDAGPDDGWPKHAPVGLFSPNPFGLHDIIANVSEFCSDAYASGLDDYLDQRDHDLRRTAAYSRRATVRGASYSDSGDWLRVTLRPAYLFDTGSETCGLRPIFPLPQP